MSALPMPYVEEADFSIPACAQCGDETLRVDVCLRCGFCHLCGEYADDCTCSYRAEDRYIDHLAQEYENGRLGA